MGDLLYDAYLRKYNLPTLDIKDSQLIKFTYEFYSLFYFWENYLNTNFVKAVNETGVKNISGGGGVMANSRLREKMNIFAENNDLNIYLPTPKLSTDNAAMICVAAQNNLITNDINADDVRLSSIIA
ncbi:MAG: hypothetical protein CL496_04050 [Actinobacteria bacterium]|nr:hypothetical protein [Actinomycetota bacterium]